LNGHQPLFAFGHGLSYGSFAYEQLSSTLQGDRVSVSFKVKNTSARVASTVPQVYVSPVGGGWEAPRRLGGFAKLSLQPGESRTVSISIDPRLLARFDVSDQTWRIAAGDYRIQLGTSSADVRLTSTLRLAGAAFDVRGVAR
jgi:beta-glucosidase